MDKLQTLSNIKRKISANKLYIEFEITKLHIDTHVVLCYSNQMSICQYLLTNIPDSLQPSLQNPPQK